MSDRIVLLGTGTCQLQADRMASSVLVELDDLRLVFDMGRGVASRLTGLGFGQDQIEHVVLSHFHPDHLSDLLPWLHAASWSGIDPREKDLHLYGPVGLRGLFAGLTGLFSPDSLVREDRFEVHLHEVRDGSFRIDDHDFRFCDLPPAGNHGLRFTHAGRTYALTGDSWFHEQEIAFLRDVDLGIIDAGHISDDEIVELAATSRAERLVCSHLYRELDEASLNARARANGYAGRLIVGVDLMTFDL